MVEWKKIGDIAKCYAGATPSTKNASYWEDGIIPWMSSGEVHQGIVTHTATYITQLGYDNSSTKMIPKGSIVIALAGQGKTRGSVAITDIELCTNQSLCGIVLDKSDIINKYVYYFLGTRYNHLRKISSGEGTRGGLNLKMISEYEIPIPAISEQVRIVGILDTFTSSIDNLKQQIAQRRKQYEYYRDQLLDLEGKEGVEKKTLGEIGEFIRGNGIQKSDFVEEGFSCIHYGQIHARYGFSAKETISKIEESLYKRCKKAKKGDVVLATTSEDAEGVAKPFVWLGEDDAAVSGDAFIYHHNQIGKFMGHQFLTHKFMQFKVKYATGAKVVRISGDNMAKYEVALPSIEEQSRIVSILDIFEASIANLEAQLSQREKQYEYYRNKLLTFE